MIYAPACRPFAVILSCSYSRVPPDVLFDQGIGDLFVIRVAGNVATADALGSIEYAVDHLDAKLIVVTCHRLCGAVQAVSAPDRARTMGSGSEEEHFQHGGDGRQGSPRQGWRECYRGLLQSRRWRGGFFEVTLRVRHSARTTGASSAISPAGARKRFLWAGPDKLSRVDGCPIGRPA
jgi:hypothetical protein